MHFPLAGDWDFLIRLYKAGGKFCPIDKILAAMRFGGLSSDIDRAFAETIKIWEKYLPEAPSGKAVLRLQQSLPQAKRRSCSRIYNIAFWWLGMPQGGIESEAWGRIPSDWTFESPFDFPWHLL